MYRVGSGQGAPALTPLAWAPLTTPVAVLPLAPMTAPAPPIPLAASTLPLAAPELGTPSTPELALTTGDVPPLPASKPWYEPPGHPVITKAARSVGATRVTKSEDLMTRLYATAVWRGRNGQRFSGATNR